MRRHVQCLCTDFLYYDFVMHFNVKNINKNITFSVFTSQPIFTLASNRASVILLTVFLFSPNK
jgi:hypothetical protein